MSFIEKVVAVLPRSIYAEILGSTSTRERWWVTEGHLGHPKVEAGNRCPNGQNSKCCFSTVEDLGRSWLAYKRLEDVPNESRTLPQLLYVILDGSRIHSSKEASKELVWLKNLIEARFIDSDFLLNSDSSGVESTRKSLESTWRIMSLFSQNIKIVKIIIVIIIII